MKFIAFSLPNQISHLITYNFAYPLNILMIMCLYFYSILQLESKSIAIKKINICLFFKDIFQIIIFISFYYIEKKESKLSKREITYLVQEKLNDKVVLSKQTLLNNPNLNLELKMQKSKEDIIKITLILIVGGISDFLNEKLLYVFAPRYNNYEETYFIYFICFNYFSVYFSNKLIQNNFPLYKHQKLSLFIILSTSIVYFLVMIIILVVSNIKNNNSFSILFLILYSFPISIINGIKFVFQKQLLEKDYVSEHLILGAIGAAKLVLHFISNFTTSDYFKYSDGFSNFFPKNNFLLYTLFCSIVFIFSSLLGDYCLLHILYRLNPNFSLLAIQTGVSFLFMLYFIYFICFGGNLIITNIFLFIVLLVHNFSGLIYNEIIILKFFGLDEYTQINLEVNEKMDIAHCSLKNSNSSSLKYSITNSSIESSDSKIEDSK